MMILKRMGPGSRTRPREKARGNRREHRYAAVPEVFVTEEGPRRRRRERAATARSSVVEAEGRRLAARRSRLDWSRLGEGCAATTLLRAAALLASMMASHVLVELGLGELLEVAIRVDHVVQNAAAGGADY